MIKNTIEIWKAIKGYEGYYEVSNLGRIKSVERVVISTSKYGKQYNKHVKEKMLNPRKTGKDYLKVDLSKNGITEPKLMHQLVAEAFVPNTHGYTVVHHKNHDQKDNRAENLEWIDGGEHTAMHSAERAKRVDQLDKITGEVLRQWDRARDVERELGYKHNSISRCARGEKGYKAPYGFVWKYTSK